MLAGQRDPMVLARMAHGRMRRKIPLLREALTGQFTSHHAFLCQMTADACGCAVVSGPAEASALGNVMMQAVAVGELENIVDGRASVGKSLELATYSPQRGEGWADAQARYVRLEKFVSERQEIGAAE